ncbi:MAG: V-type ATP synthase subunit D [Erysipelotrichia bacterium]|nr:V-type ATP synthase subunit D [Erysipelotrichia bacterium]
MAQKITATKGNLIKVRKSLLLAENGYSLMDRKRNILIREMMGLVDKVKLLRDEIKKAYDTGYYLLQQANLSTGVISSLAEEIPVDNSIRLTYRSVMGVEIPDVIYEAPKKISIPYGLAESNSRVDEAFLQFQKVKELTMVLAEVDNSVYRLASAIQKTQKRANALKNIVIPGFEKDVREISDSLEEKEREEFSRMKVIKQEKQGTEENPV